MTTRRDLLLEVETQLDGSGDYTSDWIETADVFSVAIALDNAASAQIRVREALTSTATNFTYTHILGAASSGQFNGSVNLASRYFRLEVDGGTASATFRASVRAVSSGVIDGLD